MFLTTKKIDIDLKTYQIIKPCLNYFIEKKKKNFKCIHLKKRLLQFRDIPGR